MNIDVTLLINLPPFFLTLYMILFNEAWTAVM